MTDISPRVRNLILILAAGAAALVVFGFITGAEWLQFVGGMLKGLVL